MKSSNIQSFKLSNSNVNSNRSSLNTSLNKDKGQIKSKRSSFVESLINEYKI
jgi:hypothetical protein